MSFIKIKNIEIKEEDNYVCRNVSLDVEKGEIFIILGSYSSGGEHLLKAVAGITEPSSGNIFIGGQDIFAGNQEEIIKKRKWTSFVFQNGGLISNLTIRQNFLLPLNVHFPKLSLRSKESKISSLLTKYGLLSVLDKRPSELELDKKKLLGFLRALITDPDILLIHEPLSNMSIESREAIIATIRRIVSDGKTIIINTHTVDEIADIADKVVVMESGKITFIGRVEDVREIRI